MPLINVVVVLIVVGSTVVACEYIYSDGREDQKYPQCRRCDWGGNLAASGLWAYG